MAPEQAPVCPKCGSLMKLVAESSGAGKHAKGWCVFRCSDWEHGLGDKTSSIASAGKPGQEFSTMTRSPPTIIYEPSEAGEPYVAAAFSPDGQVLASRPFSTQAGAEAFLQAFMQEKAGEYGLVHEGSAPQRSGPR